MASEMRRDNLRIVRDDNFAWMFDTFYDRRNGILFEVSAIGGRVDAQVTNESQINMDWNPVWDVAVAKFQGGWVMEAALPFKSLRYRSGLTQIWGFQARRTNRWKNETSYLTPLSRPRGPGGISGPRWRQRWSVSRRRVGRETSRSSPTLSPT